MSFLPSLFSLKTKNVELDTELVEQAIRELSAQIQTLQQNLVTEIRQLIDNINTAYTRKAENVQGIATEIQQLSKSIDTLHQHLDALQTPASHIKTLSDTIKQIQGQIRGLSSQIDQLASPPPPKYNGRLDAALDAHLQTSEAAASILEKVRDTSGKVKESFSGAMQKINEVEGSIRDAVTKTDLFPLPEPITEKMHALETEKEAVNEA